MEVALPEQVRDRVAIDRVQDLVRLLALDNGLPTHFLLGLVHRFGVDSDEVGVLLEVHLALDRELLILQLLARIEHDDGFVHHPRTSLSR